jgi:hypothetical protein
MAARTFWFNHRRPSAKLIPVSANGAQLASAQVDVPGVDVTGVNVTSFDATGADVSGREAI